MAVFSGIRRHLFFGTLQYNKKIISYIIFFCPANAKKAFLVQYDHLLEMLIWLCDLNLDPATI